MLNVLVLLKVEEQETLSAQSCMVTTQRFLGKTSPSNSSIKRKCTTQYSCPTTDTKGEKMASIQVVGH